MRKASNPRMAARAKAGKQGQAAGQQPANNAGENSSLLSKFRDAVRI